MSMKLSSLEIQDFLKDFEDNAKTEVYERGKEKEEIIQIAKAKMGIDLTNNTDLAGFKTVYTFADVANDNGARLPKHLLLKALPTLIGKPVNINHIRNYVVGFFIDYRYIEAENKVIAYGIFFKSNFGEEWSEARQLLKSNLLGTSHEVWCPRKSRKYLSDGTYEAQAIEFAGGALIYKTHPDAMNPDKTMDTAYQGCDVLEMAKKYMDKNQNDLIFASLQIPTKKNYRQEDLIVAGEAEPAPSQTKEVETRQLEPAVSTEPETSTQETQLPQVPKITCGHCGHRFETNEVGEIPCPECRAIVDRAGTMLYPPQKIRFTFRDPEDGSSNWRLIEDSEEKAIVKNLDNGRIYELRYQTKDDNDELLGKLKFVYIGHTSCPQCGHGASFSTVSSVGTYEINCKHCGLKYHTNIKKDGLRKQIGTYKDITEEFKAKQTSENPETADKELAVAGLIRDSEEPELELEVSGFQNNLDLEVTSLNVVGNYSNDTFELDIASFLEDVPFENLDDSLLVAQVLTTKVRKTLTDSDFAVVQNIDGKKVRKFPIHDEAHVRNALARLAQEVVQRTLTKMGIKIESVRKRILARAKKLGMKDVTENQPEQAALNTVDRYKMAVRKMSNKIRELKKALDLDIASLASANKLETAKIQEEADKKISWYKVNAVELVKRREVLGKFAEDQSDEKIMDDTLYAKLKLEKENALLKASRESGSDVVGDKYFLGKDDAEMDRLKNDINRKAFGNS